MARYSRGYYLHVGVIVLCVGIYGMVSANRKAEAWFDTVVVRVNATMHGKATRGNYLGVIVTLSANCRLQHGGS